MASMKPRAADPACETNFAVSAYGRGNKAVVVIAILLLAAVIPASVLSGGQAGGELQEKLAALKQSVAENQQKLHKYQWTETTQLTLNGDAKPATQSMCSYGPDG